MLHVRRCELVVCGQRYYPRTGIPSYYSAHSSANTA